MSKTMFQYDNMPVKTEDDVFGWGEIDVPAKKVFIVVNTFAYQGSTPAVQFMCGWEDFDVNGFTEEDYYQCMMHLDEGQSMVVDCDYDGVVIMCVAANSHAAYIKQVIDKIQPYTIPKKFCGTYLTEEQWDETARAARKSWKELKERVEGMTFQQVVDEFEPTVSRPECRGESAYNFRCHYRSVIAPVFKTSDGGCRVGNECTAVVKVSANKLSLTPATYQIIFNY